MKIGIYDLNECSTLDYKKRIEIYKSCGFTSVGVYIDENYMSNGESYIDIINYAKNVGLEVNQVHVDYKISNLICDDSSNTYFEYVEKKIKECVELKIPYIVLHASKGDDAPILKEEGIEKLKDLMKKYEKSGVCLCFENVRDNRNLAAIMSINIEGIGMCYDLGHAYCYDDVYSLFEKYKNKIKCTHLHNNYRSDTHNLLSDGEIDCKNVISLINGNEKIDNCLEIFPKRGKVLSEEEFILFVKNCYKEYLKLI